MQAQDFYDREMNVSQKKSSSMTAVLLQSQENSSDQSFFSSFFFFDSKKRSLGKYLKEKPQMAGKEQKHIPEWAHMCKPSHTHAKREGERAFRNMSYTAMEGGGGATPPYL